MNAKTRSPAARLAMLAGAALLAALAPTPARADTCWIGFRNGITPTLNGARGMGEWDDASVLQSGHGCLNMLIDAPGGNSERTVRVYSKKDATHLYLLFEVGDATNMIGAPGTSLGEKIILHLDPNHSRDPLLNAGGGDHRYVFTHRWANSAAIQREHYESQASTGACAAPVLNEWGNSTPWPAADVQMQHTGSGYTVEMRFPLAGAGGLGVTAPLAHDIGLAFAVLNDLGNSSDYSATRFPESLPFTTNVNSLATDETNSCNDWLSPLAWGGGYHNQAPGDVTFDHTPVYWQANSVTATDCANSPTWNYYPGKSCKVKVNAQVLNTGGATTRNLLYLWGDHDAGTVRWTFMDLQLGVNIPAGGGLNQSVLWNPPSGLAAHPCIRVYALPNAFRGDFTEAQIRALLQAPHTTITDLENKYGLQPIHSAQRNIHREPTASMCPHSTCLSTAMAEWPSALFAGGTDLVSRLFAPSPLFAQNRTARRDTLRGREVKWPAADRRQYGADNVGVQVRTYGYQHPLRRQRIPYRIIEPLGGALQMVPAELLRKQQRHAMVFNITAPNTGRYTVLPVIDQHVPAGMNVRVDLRAKPMEFRDGETQRLEGVLVYAGGPTGGTGGQDTTPGGGKGCPVSAGLAMAGLVLLGLGRRTRRRE